MKYTLDRFKEKPRSPEPQDGEVSDAVTGVTQLSTWAGRLERIIDKLDKKKQVGDQAKKSMAALMLRARSVEEENVDVMGNLLGRMLKFVGKKVFTAIVRPILQFASRIAMSVVRIAARVALRFIVWPVIELVGAALMAALASPVGWAVLGGAALLGGGYLLLKNRTPEVIEVEDSGPSGAVVEGSVPEVAPEVAKEVPRTRFEKALDTVRQSAPIQAIEKVVERPKVFKAKKGAKFQGFGDDVDGYIREAAGLYPILKEDVLRGFVKMEGGWKGAMSPTGAIGTGQFIVSTWNSLISKGGAQIGMTPITGVYGEERDASGKKLKPSIKPNPKGNFRTPEDPRFNKRVNTLATGLLAAANAKMLEKAGLPITGANLYMMHNIGPGIINVMKGKPASDATLLAMRQNGMGGQINTAEKFLDYQKGRFEDAYEEANTSTQMVADTPKMKKGVTVDRPTPSSVSEKAQDAKTAAASPTSGQDKDLIRGPNNTIVRM